LLFSISDFILKSDLQGRGVSKAVAADIVGEKGRGAIQVRPPAAADKWIGPSRCVAALHC
jgi:hypothetical protein